MCESNPCTNGGTCTTMTSSYRCLCVEGFRGINCQGAFHNYSLKKNESMTFIFLLTSSVG